MFNVQYSTEWEGVIKVLSEFAGKPYEPAKKSEPNNNRDNFNKELFEIRPARMEDLTYLQYERMLLSETIEAFITHVHMVRQNGKSFNNIGFPYTIPEKYSDNTDTKGYELVNYMFKGQAIGSNRKEAVNAKSLLNLSTNNLLKNWSLAPKSPYLARSLMMSTTKKSPKQNL